ncbi:MAG: AraC family transcriptional regulator [Lachnospiraceae bacterium]|nr:AraC family transcriptional regulator [Lachnospiraceae bacterium]
MESDRQSGGIRFLLEGVVINAVMVSFRRFTEGMPEHAHGENVYEIHLVTEGEETVLLNRQPYPLSPGMLYITGPGVLHEQSAGKENPLTEFGVYLQLENGAAGGALIQCLQQHPLWHGRGRSLLLPLAEQILREQAGELPGSAEKLPHLLAEFLIECIRSMTATDEVKPPSLPKPEERFVTHRIREENVLLVIDEIFLYEYREITLEKLAERLGFSVRQTQRLLERIYGKSFTEKKLEARMSAAVTLLQNSSYSITEISERLGYSSVEHFSHAFTKYYGDAPGKVRKRTVKKKDNVKISKRGKVIMS